MVNNDNSNMSAAELAELASELTPGGTHVGGYLVNLVRELSLSACPRLVAACLYRAWKGGKRGFQFLPLPDPDRISLEDYVYEVEELLGDLECGNSHELLVGEDRAFFDSLPPPFVAYRGCRGTTLEMASAGVCWSASREVARWFAATTMKEPVLLSTWVRKSDVHLAFASEFEVVIRPGKVRRLKPEPYDLGKSKRPQMRWNSQRFEPGVQAAP